MGVVYLAEHPVLGRQVAIKTVSSNYGRFLREARAASRCLIRTSPPFTITARPRAVSPTS